TAGILLGHASSTGGKTQTATVSALNTRDLARDFGYIPPALSAAIEGTVFDDYNNNASKQATEAGIAAVQLGLYNLFGTLINTYTTPIGGTFRFAGIAGGLYQINVITPPTGYGGTSTTLPLSINVADGTTNTGNDIGYLPFGSLSGNIFSDTSGEGVKNIGENTGFSGVIVERYNAAMTLIDSYASDVNGDYQFSKIAAADYYVQVQAGSAPIGHGATTAQPLFITVTDGVINSGNNIGYQPNGNVTGTVFLDDNIVDGIKDVSETTIFPNVIIDRYTIGMGYIDSYTTDVNGLYQFNLLPAGDYNVQVRVDPTGYGATTTQPRKITATNATTSTGNDLGYQTFGSLTGTVFSDANGNAVLDGEAGVAGVVVDRYSSGVFIDSYTADASGNFQFIQIPAGTYDLYAHLPTGFGATTGQPLAATATLGITSSGHNIGFQASATISGKVFADVNNSGGFDGGDAWLSVATVYLKIGAMVIDTYITSASGGYYFTGLLVGTNPSITYTVDVDQTIAPINNAALTTANDPASVLVTVGSTNAVADIGYNIQGSIAGSVYEDLNASLVFDALPLPADTALLATVNLYNSGMSLLNSTTSAVDGSYIFGGLVGADYYVEVITPATYSAVVPVVIAPATEPRLAITLASGTVLTGQNFGFSKPPNLVVSKTTLSPFTARDIPLNYTITITNTGGTAKNVVVTDWVPNTAFAGWLGVPLPTASIEGVVTPAATATELWFNGVQIAAALPTATYTQTVVANTTTSWSMAPTGFTLNNGDILKFVFSVASLVNGTEGNFFNSLQIDYLNGATPVTEWHADANSLIVTRTYIFNKIVKAVNGVAVTGTPTIDVGDVVTWELTITNLRGKGAINKDELAVATLTETLPIGFKYVLGSTKLTSPGNGIIILTPLAVDATVFPVASAIGNEVINYVFNGGVVPAKGALPIAGDSFITGPSLNDIATLQFDAYAYDAITPNAPVAGTHNNRVVSLAERPGKAGKEISETIIGAPVIVSTKSVIEGYIFQDLVIDNLYNPLNDSTFNGVTVELRQGATVIDSYTTGSNGLYHLLAPAGGSYSVVITDALAVLTGYNNTVAAAMPLALVSSSLTTGQNFAYILAGLPGTITGTVFADTSLDGIKQGGELGITAVTVWLKTTSGVTLGTAVTAAGGTFSFTGQPAGNYLLDVDENSVAIAAYYNTPTAAPSDPYTVTLTAGGTTIQDSGWALGSIFSGMVFDDYSAQGVKDVGEPGHGNVSLQLVNTGTGLVVDNYTTQSSPFSALGQYQFNAVPAGTYRIDVTDVYSEMTAYTLTTVNQPMTPVTSIAGTNYINYFGYLLPPNITATKSMPKYTLDRGEKMNITITVTNTGGGVSAFSIADVLPAVAPASPFVGGLGVFTASIVPYVYDATSSISLDGLALVAGVDYIIPVAASATPTWGSIALPGNSTLVINFTALQPGGAGNEGGPNYNGLAIQHSTPAVVVDYPDVFSFSTFRDATHNKIISHINGIAVGASPTIYRGDRVTFQLRVSNTTRAKIVSVTQFTDSLPKLNTDSYGFYYAIGSSILTDPTVGVPAVIADPVIVAGPGISTYQTLTWTTAAATLATYPSEVMLQFDAYADTLMTAGNYTNNSSSTAVSKKLTVILYASYPMTLSSSTPTLTVIKSSNIVLAKPGQVITYTIQISNSGAGRAHNVLVDDHMSPYTNFQLDFGAGVPFAFTDGGIASGLGLGIPIYSNNDGITYIYTPASGAGGAGAGFDANITNWQIPMVGQMNGSGSSFTMQYKAIVE
ncbi:MAG: SdrD B-like domain-containing protein, partial [Mariprofundales bacterium]